MRGGAAGNPSRSGAYLAYSAGRDDRLLRRHSHPSAVQTCEDARRSGEIIESSRSMGDLHRRPTVGILRRKGSEPIQPGGAVGTTGYCAQDAEPYG